MGCRSFVQTILEHILEEKKKLCQCGAELKFDNVVMTSNPPQYPYTCPKCGKRYIYREDGTRWEW